MPSCGFCLSRRSECHYSLRRPNRPRAKAKGSDGGAEGGERAGKPGVKIEGKLAPRHVSGDEQSSELHQGRQRATPVGWKRIRLSASPATGLVGTKENVFLGSFFSCLGFLPLTHERLIRGTLMGTLLAPTARPDTVVQGTTKDPNPAKTEKPSQDWGGDDEEAVSDPASACALWCAIAMGALVQGQPSKQVAPYMHLAWMSLSMLRYGHCGEWPHQFCRYLQLARKVVNRLPEQTTQKQEINDLVMMGNDTRIFHTAALEVSELNAYCTDNSPALEVPDIVPKSDLCRLLLQVDRRMMKAFLRDHRAQTAAAHDEGDDERPTRHVSPGGEIEVIDNKRCIGDKREYSGLEKISGGATCREGDDEVYPSGISIKMVGISIDSTKIDEEIGPSLPGDETWKCTEEARKLFARLENAVEAPEIRDGVGGLLYNSILGYLDMVTGSVALEAGFERVKHCVEIISRRHLSHCLLSFLVKLGNVEWFEELRQAYNSVRAEDALEVPPHAEWTMLGFCDHIFCRSMDHLEKDCGYSIAMGPMASAGDLDIQRWLSEEPHRLHDTYQNNMHWASLAPEFHSSAALPGQVFSAQGWTDLAPPDLVDAHKSPGQEFEWKASAPGFPLVVPYPMASINQASSIGGLESVIPSTRRAGDGASVNASARSDRQTQNGWSARATNSMSKAGFSDDAAGAMWPFPHSLAPANCVEMSDLTPEHVFCANMVHNGQRELCGAGGSPRSDTGGAEGSYDSSAKRTDDRFPWWCDADISCSVANVLDGYNSAGSRAGGSP